MRPGRARLRPLPPQRQRLRPRRAPAGLPAPDAQAPGRRRARLTRRRASELLQHLRPLHRSVDNPASNEAILSLLKLGALPRPSTRRSSEVQLPGAPRRRTRTSTRPVRHDRRSRRPSTSSSTAQGSADQGAREPTPTSRRREAQARRAQAPTTSRASSDARRPRARTRPIARRAARRRLPVLLPDAAHDRLALRRATEPRAVHDHATRTASAPGLPARALRRAHRRVLRRPGDDLDGTRRSSTTRTARARSTAASCSSTTTAPPAARRLADPARPSTGSPTRSRSRSPNEPQMIAHRRARCARLGIERSRAEPRRAS